MPAFLSSSALRALRDIYPGDALVTDPAELLVYGADASRGRAQPWAAVLPERPEQVVETLRLAHLERIPVYPRGRGTNRVGACLPLEGGLVIATARLNRILEITPEDFACTVQPGVITAALRDACAARGLLYAPDPASVAYSTIGGNLAQNAGGLRALKYGTTRDWVLGLHAALPGGSILRTGSRCHKDVAGLDLTRLFVGAEGTLGFVLQATLKLIPLPQASASLLAVFAAEDQAPLAAADALASGVLPAALEYLSAEAMEALEHLGDAPWPAGGRSALLFKVDGSPESARADLARLRNALERHSPAFLEQGDTPAQEDRLWNPRRQISQAAFHFGPNKASDDIAVPRGQVANAVARIRNIARSRGLVPVVFGHLGDGNLHVSLMHDASEPDQARHAAQAKQEVLALTIELGGTISGEHGVGVSKLDWLERMRGPEAVSIMRQVKAVFDPHGIMNPGKAY
ncbi:putative FAD-linked oxidoreductase [Fundidesulfovibrio magnetotacticus]|uniref:Putative FAD-linked oxidoreductase n=1 Tax=Fundidesulfovibrio magnetotacticus TaxID=2730080 RepID=A0A6V8LSB5_9BACT|nr:FAD-linked oxidase C-terminal domain-containing protein [Fundidesulfovibrio magnetotacticus]GFK93461.1 putative FAD-linked oxidoreductase [Fundidesulfovibrio magnetotacticus]